MKYLHLSTGDVRGAFTGAYRLHENLKSAGHESKMFVRIKDSGDPDVISPPQFIQLVTKIVSKFINLLIMRCFSNRDEFHKRYFFPYWGIVNLKHLYSSITFKPDLIIVYYVADFLSAKDLRNIQEHYNAPVSFYLMDGGMLTGGCHYPWECKGYTNKCGNCPILRRPHVTDWSSKIWDNRNNVFSKMKYSIFAGSNWLYVLTGKSSLHAKKRIDRVLMGIDPNMYRPRDKASTRAELGLSGIPNDSIVIYFGAQQIGDQRKGFSYLFSALEILGMQISDEVRNNIVLVTVGAKKPELLNKLQIKHHHIEYLQDKETFAKTYNIADIFVCPSIEDAGPMMINESIMAGTPVISFRMGVAEDLIIDGETGYISNNFDSQDLANKIYKLIEIGRVGRTEMSNKCRELAVRLTSQQVQVDKIVALTNELKTEYMER